MLPFGGGNQFLSQRSSAEGLANGAGTPTLPKTSGRRVRYVVGEREDGAPGLFRQASRVDGGDIMQSVCTEVVGNLRRGRK